MNSHSSGSYQPHSTRTWSGSPPRGPGMQFGPTRSPHQSAEHSTIGQAFEQGHSGAVRVQHILHTPAGPIADQYTTLGLANPEVEDIGEEVAKLYSNFKSRPRPRKYFIEGRVFLVLWTEPARSDASMMTSGISVGQYGEKTFSKIRRFVVVKPGENHCTAIPISTYRGRGVAAKGKQKAEHCLVHSGKKSPSPTEAEEGILVPSIRVDPDDREEKLDEMSRLNLGALHTIDHCVKVRTFGNVNPRSVRVLKKHLAAVWGTMLGVQPQLCYTEDRLVAPHTQARSPASETDVGGATAWQAAYGILRGSGMSEEQIRSAVRYCSTLLAADEELPLPTAKRPGKGFAMSSPRRYVDGVSTFSDLTISDEGDSSGRTSGSQTKTDIQAACDS